MNLLNINTKNIGQKISKFGVVLILLWLGIYKFTPTEAEAIRPLLENSPLFSWQLKMIPLQTLSKIIGTTEIIAAILIILEFKFKRLAQFGYLIVCFMFLSTLSFMFTTPNLLRMSDGVFIPDWFILKDIVLLGFVVSRLDLKLLLSKK